MKEFIETLKNNPDGAFDFICNNYYKMSKDELKDIIKELLYAIHVNAKAEHDIILNDVAEELINTYDD